MKLSEAIRMNGMMKPQGFGALSIYSEEAPCALGGALQSIGKQRTDGDVVNYGILRHVWWKIADTPASCPECGEGLDDVLMNIFHLNDTHRWTRNQIADWVATFEPQDPSAPESNPCTEEVTHAIR